MKNQKVSQKIARRIVLNAQLLDGRTKLSAGKKGITEIFRKLGYIQIDTISVVQRTHHHTLWARHADYKLEMLQELQAKDRQIFEYWGHAMSYMPMEDYRFCLPRMRNFQKPKHKWVTQRPEQSGKLMPEVLERIRNEGPLSAKDFEPPPGRKGGTWWDWKPAKFALELLFWQGELMISERRKFLKIYDLTERVLPSNIDASFPSEEELGTFFVQKALSALGLFREKGLRSFLQPDAGRDSDFLAADKKIILATLNRMVENGDITRVEIQGDPDSTYFVSAETLAAAAKFKKRKSPVFFLSPFDNLIIQRDRAKNIFDFEYTLECYVPAPKRKYGYFVLPILWEEQLVGRMDPKADRKEKTLYIRNLVFEPGFVELDNFLPAFAKKLWEFAAFNDCERIKIEKISPAKIRKELNALIKRQR